LPLESHPAPRQWKLERRVRLAPTNYYRIEVTTSIENFFAIWQEMSGSEDYIQTRMTG